MARNKLKIQGNTFSLDGHRIDGRTTIGRTYKNHVAALSSQIGDLSPSEIVLLKRAAALAALCEQDEDKFLNGKDVDQENYRRNVAALKGVMVNLGLAKKSRDITKSDQRVIDSHADAVLNAD